VIRFILTLIMIYAFMQAFAMREPDPGDDVPVALPARADGPFRTEDDAQRCGAILGRALQCGSPKRDRNRLTDYCVAGLTDASGDIQHRLYEAFLEGARDGHRNVYGWSCTRVQRTLSSPPLSAGAEAPG
jgi:hypothetical protein